MPGSKRVHYGEDAEVKRPVEATDLPARSSEDAPRKEVIEGSGPGASPRNVSPARPRDAALERDDA